MHLNTLRATLWVAFLLILGLLTYFGLKSNKAEIDFNQLSSSKNDEQNNQNALDFENLLKNIGNSTSLVKPDVLNSTDTNRLSLSIQLLDSMKQYLYAAVLSEKLASQIQSSKRFHDASKYFLMELYQDESAKNELLLTKKSKENLEKSLQILPKNLNAKVDLAVTVYNLNKLQTPENQTDLMKPALLLREVLAVDSNHIDGLYYIGKLAVESNQLEKAIVRFKKILSLQPQNKEACLELSQIYLLQGNKTESKFWADKAQSIKHNHIK